MAMRRIDRGLLLAIRDRESLYEAASPYVVWDQRLSRPAAGDYWACCPFHEERTPSFHVRLPLASFKCFGCGASGDVIEFVRRIKGISFVAAIDELIGNVTPKPLTAPERHERLRQQLKYRTARDSGAIAYSMRLWEQCEDVVDRHPAMRRYLCDVRGLPEVIVTSAARAGGLRLGRSRDACGDFLALAALIQSSTGESCGVSFTRVEEDGSGKASAADPVRKIIGRVRGGAVRLLGDSQARTLAIAEGIETALSYSALYSIPCWATLGADNLASFEPPDGIERLIIAADSGGVGARAARSALERLSSRLQVDIESPPFGADWNDALRIKAL